MHSYSLRSNCYLLISALTHYNWGSVPGISVVAIRILQSQLHYVMKHHFDLNTIVVLILSAVFH